MVSKEEGGKIRSFLFAYRRSGRVSPNLKCEQTMNNFYPKGEQRTAEKPSRNCKQIVNKYKKLLIFYYQYDIIYTEREGNTNDY